MTTAELILQYQSRVDQLNANLAQVRSGQIAIITVLCVAVTLTAAIVFAGFKRHNAVLWYASLPISALFVTTEKYRRQRSSLRQCLRLARFYEQAIARTEGRWHGNGAGGDEFGSPDHVYAKDLGLFGTGSLFELLCTARTGLGRRRLAEYLLNVPDSPEILERQEAVRELRARNDLRERVCLLGESTFRESNWDTFSNWLGAPAFVAPALVRYAALVTSIALGVIFLLAFAKFLAWAQVLPAIAVLLCIHGGAGLWLRGLHAAKRPLCARPRKTAPVAIARAWASALPLCQGRR